MDTLTQSPSTPPQRVVLAAGNPASQQVQPCDFRAVGGIDKARLAPIMSATEAFAAPLAETLQSKLSLNSEISLRSSDQMSCRTFLEKAGSSYLTSLQLGTQGDIALLQIDSGLLFPILDRLLGGNGASSELSREVTEIESHIAREFVRLICQQLQSAWQEFGTPISVGARQSSVQLQRLFSANDTGLRFAFSVNLQSSGGDFQLMLPTASLGSFLATASPTLAEQSRKGTMSSRFADKLLATTFGLKLSLHGGKVPANDLLNLSTGKIIPLRVPVRVPATLTIEGHNSFEAVPVRVGHHRGAQLVGRVPQTQIETEKTV
jgi:flagellar motor switch protein FliM